MNQELGILLITAVSIEFFHTLFGPDHYVPFIAMSKARNWSTLKTTILCGEFTRYRVHLFSRVWFYICGQVFIDIQDRVSYTYPHKKSSYQNYL
jgi:hypothetical protein